MSNTIFDSLFSAQQNDQYYLAIFYGKGKVTQLKSRNISKIIYPSGHAESAHIYVGQQQSAGQKDI